MKRCTSACVGRRTGTRASKLIITVLGERTFYTAAHSVKGICRTGHNHLQLDPIAARLAFSPSG